ncbi:transposase [Deltaproteobacteria bacterium TL4]
MRYRRFQTGTWYFFTVVTFQRRPLFQDPENVNVLREAFRAIMKKHPFHLDAIVVLPDHLHCIWELPEQDHDFPMRWRQIKSDFTRNCSEEYKSMPSASHRSRKEQSIWQRRYWEHQLRDEDDYWRHVDYIHYNPVKHGWVKEPVQWQWSSVHRFIEEKRISPDWGSEGSVSMPENIGME